MPLGLDDHQLPQVYTGNVSIDHLTWWFWIKAGAGLMLGAYTIGAAAVLLTWVLFVVLLGGTPMLLHLLFR